MKINKTAVTSPPFHCVLLFGYINYLYILAHGQLMLSLLLYHWELFATCNSPFLLDSSSHSGYPCIHTQTASYWTAFENMPKMILNSQYRSLRGLWEMVPSHSTARDRLEVISSSHCIQSLASLCSLIHFDGSVLLVNNKVLGRWHVGESNANTLSPWERLQPTVNWNVIENASVWCLT